MELLLSEHVDVNVRDYKGATPLHRVKSVECMTILMDAGADVFIQDDEGNTPLHVLCYEGYYIYYASKRFKMNAQHSNRRIELATIHSYNNIAPNMTFLISEGQSSSPRSQFTCHQTLRPCLTLMQKLIEIFHL